MSLEQQSFNLGMSHGSSIIAPLLKLPRSQAKSLFFAELGTTHDCGSFPSDGQCNGPDETPCKSYKPPQTFYVHLAIHNLYAAFSTIHEKLQDNAIIDISSTDQAITNKYGPQPEMQAPIFSLSS